MQYYTPEELNLIVKRTARVLNSPISDAAAMELASRSRGTPRIANRIFKEIDLEVTKKALERLKVDDMGLDDVDYQLLKTIVEKFNGGPVGVESIASVIGEEVTTIEDVYEPYLLQTGLLKRTPRGRVVTDKGYKHLNINHQNSLFDMEVN